jgi:hypothetical protein
MTQNVALDFEDPVPEEFFDSTQEMMSGSAVNVALVASDATHVRLLAGAGHDQVSLSIGGAYRYQAANVTVAHPGGAAGIYNVWATAQPNQALPAAGPAGGDHSIGLAVRTQAAGAPAGPLISRLIGQCVWDGAAITSVRSTVGRVAASGQLDSTAGGMTLGPAAGVAKDVPGTSFDLLLVRDSFLLVTLMMIASPAGAGGSVTIDGFLSVDGVDDLGAAQPAVIEAPGDGLNRTGVLLRRIPLAAGLHTIKGRAKWVDSSGTSQAPLLGAVSLQWQLVPQ